MARGVNWTEEEVNILKDLYPTTDTCKLSEILGKGEKAIKIKASRLSIHKRDYFEVWTPEEEEFLKVNANKIRNRELCLILNKQRSNLLNKLKQLEIKVNKYISNKRVPYDQEVFSTINQNSCYWAGFIAADGCITDRNTLRVGLSNRDINHLETLRDFLKSQHKIVQAGQDCSSFGITSRFLIRDLKTNFNLGPRKSLTLLPPNLEGDLALSYIAGYIDGDGCITIINQDNYNYLLLDICGTKEILDWIKYHFNKIIHNDNRLYQKVKDKNCYSYRISCSKAQTILGKIKQLGIPFLMERKWSKVN